MYQIQQVTDDTRQKQSIVLLDGSTVSISLYFIPMQMGWFIDELIYKDFTINGIRVCNSLNMLRQFKNQIPFGLACLSTDNREPTLQQDFSSGNSILYILTAAEVEEYEEYLRA